MKQSNLKTTLFLIGVLIISLAIVIIKQLPLYYGFFFTTAIAAIVMKLLKMPFNGLAKRALNDLRRMLPVMYVLASIGMMIAAWMYSGVLAACMDFGLAILPRFNLLLASFLLTATLSMLLGTAVGTIGTLGTMLMILGHSMAIPPAMVAGAIISGSYFGDRTSPMSSSANLTASIVGIELQTHINLILKTSLIPLVITAICYQFLGAAYSADANMLALLEAKRLVLAQTFNFQLYHFIPVFVLVGLIVFAKKGTVFSVLASLFTSFLLVVIDERSMLLFVKTIIGGYQPTAPAIAEIFSGSGFVSMISIFIVLSSASLLNSLFAHINLFNPVLTYYDRFLKTDKQLIIGSGIAANVIMLLTGNQSLPVIIAADHYMPLFEKKGINKRWLTQSLSDYMLIMVSLPPWNINALLVFSLIGIRSFSYAPYALLTLVLPASSLLYTLLTKRKFNV